MATAARLALPAWRNETCVRTFILRGIDVTGVSLRAQIRLGPDTPGAPLVSLDTVTTDGTQGLRVIGTPAAIDGVMTSTVRMTILNATMIDPAKIPPAAERGDNAVLAWALQINGATRLYGDFIVLAAVMDSDNAAAGAGAGSGGSGGSPWESATVTLIGETIEISLGDGAGVYGAITAERDRAIEAEGRKLDKAGGTMSGPIAMGGSRMTGLGAPTDAGDAARKGYVDTGLALGVSADTALGGRIDQEVIRATAAEGVAKAAGDGALAELVARAPTGSPRSGWLIAFLDRDRKSLGGIRRDGSLWSLLTGNIDAAITALKAGLTAVTAQVPARVSPRGGYLIPFLDRDGGLLGGVRRDGSLMTMGYNITEFLRSGASPTAILAALYPTANIAIWGDSLVENYAALAADLAAAFTAAGSARTVFAQGLGGQGIGSILARQGGAPSLVTFPTSGTPALPTIPASGTVAVSVPGNPLNHPGAGNGDQLSMIGFVQIGAGVAGTLTRLSGGSSYQFTRATAGTAMIVPASLPFVPDTAALRTRLAVCWAGTNDLSPGATPVATIFDQIVRYAEAQTTVQKRCIVIAPHWDMLTYGTGRVAAYRDLMALIRARYPTSCIDIVGLLAGYGNGSAEDNADIAGGLIPRSLMTGDRLHFPAGGTAYQIILAEIVRITLRNGW